MSTAATGTGARPLALVLLVLHAVPVNVTPRTLSAAVIAGCLVVIAVALWCDRRLVHVPAGAGLLAGAYLAALPMLHLHGDLALLMKAVSFGLLGLAVLVLAAGDRGLDQVVVLRAVLLAGLVQAALAVVQASTLTTPTWGLLGDRVTATVSTNPLWDGFGGRVVGSMGHPIPLGMLMVVGILLVVCHPGLVRRWQRVPLGAVLALGLALTGTRSAVVALGVGLMTVLAVRGGRWRWFWRAAFGAVAVSLVLHGDVLGWANRTVGGFSLTHRLSSAEAVPRLLAREPVEAVFGSGYGSAHDLYARDVLVDDGQVAIDIQLVSVLADAGIVGLVLFVAFLGWLVRRTPPTLLPVLVAQLVMSLFFDVVSWPAGWATVLVLAAPAASSLRRAGTPKRRGLTDDRAR